MQDRKFDEVSRYYDETYYRDAAGVAPHVSAHLQRLARRFVQPGMQVLDVACGTGEWLLAAQARGAVPAGIDISRTATGICRRRMPEGEFHTGPAETLPFPAGRFDLVSCLGSLEHFLDQAGALREMLRVARPDARFLILVPNADFLTRRLGLFRGTWQTAVREDVKTLAAWQALFESAGLRVERRWRDLHVLSPHWILLRGPWRAPLRALQALLLAIWPLRWQYQVYHLCRRAAA